jgi:nitrite reductase/ring-hydroxylating ferredoxin subunit
LRDAAGSHNAHQRNYMFRFYEATSLPHSSVQCHTFVAHSQAGSGSMPEIFIAKAAQFPDGERRLVSHAGREIGVFRWQDKFYAYENLCVHQGGPACEGVMMHKVEDVIGPDRSWRGQKFSDDEIHFVCPWHGYEYDLKTGECAADRSLKLKSFEVVRRGEDVYVIAD